MYTSVRHNVASSHQYDYTEKDPCSRKAAAVHDYDYTVMEETSFVLGSDRNDSLAGANATYLLPPSCGSVSDGVHEPLYKGARGVSHSATQGTTQSAYDGLVGAHRTYSSQPSHTNTTKSVELATYDALVGAHCTYASNLGDGSIVPAAATYQTPAASRGGKHRSEDVGASMRVHGRHLVVSQNPGQHSASSHLITWPGYVEVRGGAGHANDDEEA